MIADGHITVLGGGAWGTALALNATRAGRDTVLWLRDPGLAAELNAGEGNARYLSGIAFDLPLHAETDAASALVGAGLVLAVIPAQQLRAVLGELAGEIREGIPVVLCAKGIERETGKLPSAIAAEILPNNPLASLSGPSFAADVARGLPTAVTVASANEDQARDLCAKLSAPAFRCYASTDIAGVEAGGALKNVLAIAAGAVRGAGLGASAEAALITRGFVELRRLGTALQARPETLMGLSGLGDLILTCSSAQSRNFAYGMALGSGAPRKGLKLAEGVATAGIASKLALEHGIEAPIIAAAAALIEGKLSVADAVTALFARPLKSEDI